MNKFQFLGRLTKDPEVRYTATNNKQVTAFSIAVNRRYVAEGQERQTDFFNLTAFGKLAEFYSNYYKKGQQVLVAGRLQNRTWEDQSGTKRYATDYIVEEAYFADSKRDSDMNGGFDMPTSNSDGEFITISEDEELPF